MLNKKFFSLLSTMIKNELRGQFIKFGKSASYTQILIYLTYIIWGAVLSFSYFIKPISQYPAGVYSLYLVQFILIFFILIMELNRSLLYPEDALTLLKLPIGQDNILLSKFLSIIFFSLIFSGLFGVTWIFWGFKAGFLLGIIHFFLLLFFTILNSVIIVVLALGFYLLVYYIIGVKNIKKFFVFFTVGIMIILYYFLFFVNKNGQLSHMKEMQYLPPYYFEKIYKQFLNHHLLLGTLYFLLLVFIVFILTFLVVKLFSRFYIEFLKNVTVQSSITVKAKKIHSNPIKILLFGYLKRDNEFLLKTFNSFIFYIIFIVFIFFSKGQLDKNIFSTMALLIYFTIYVIFLSYVNIQYSKEYEAAYIYSIVPRRKGEIILNAIDILYHYFMLLPILISAIIIGVKFTFIIGVFFFILLYLLGLNLLYLFSLIKPTMPLSKKYDNKKAGLITIVYMLLLLPYIAIGIGTYYFYYEEKYFFSIIILLFILVIDFLFRYLLKRRN